MTKILNKESLVGIAPKLAEITNTVLFNDIWQREELIEIFTHLAFYTGWPSAICALERLPEKDESCR